MVELPRTPVFNRQDPNYESLHYAVHHSHSASDPPYASITVRDVDSTKQEEIQVIPEETTDELVVNNNTVGIPVYAQVIKSKRAMAESNAVAVVDCRPHTPTNPDSVPSMSVQNQDFSVGSSRNTTIIRITDNRPPPPRGYFSDDDAFGVPEQV